MSQMLEMNQSKFFFLSIPDILLVVYHYCHRYHIYLKYWDTYIENICSFAVNTINIFIECNENFGSFMSAKRE